MSIYQCSMRLIGIQNHCLSELQINVSVNDTKDFSSNCENIFDIVNSKLSAHILKKEKMWPY